MKLASFAVQMIPGLEQETGLKTGWRQLGGMRVTTNKERRMEFERTVTRARSFGLDMHLMTPAEVKQRFELMRTDDLDCGIFIPSDGNVSPSDLTMALAKGARLHGATLIEGVTVTGFDIRDGRIRGLTTDLGDITCEQAAICGGIWSRQLGLKAGVTIPIQPSHHCYMITEKIPGLSRDIPFSRDPDRWHYVREEVGSLLVGQYDPNPVPFERDDVPDDFAFHLQQENLEHWMPNFEPMIHRLPILGEVGVKSWIHGIESFTEDQNPIVGETPEVRGLFVSCGYNAYGISVGPGFGMALGEWMMHGEQPFDLWPVDIRRFARYHASTDQVRRRSIDGQGHHYTVHFPYEESTAARPLRRSALYDRLRARGASFGAKLGWERPNWFARAGETPEDRYTFGRGNWHEAVKREHLACRNAAALFDESSFGKMLVTGRDAEQALQRICAGHVGKPPGRLTYTQMLNERGGIEADVVVTRLSDTDFYIVTGTAFAGHDLLHIRRHIGADEHAAVVDMTSAFGTLGLMGPKSRAILAAVAEGDLSDAALPFGHAAQIFVAGAPVTALRITFVGELGYELHVPTEYMATVYDAVHAAGTEHGLVDAGYRAINTLRIEKSYRVWGADFGPDDTPVEAGVDFAVSYKKPVGFIGREALLRQKERPLTRRLVTIAVPDPAAIILGGETILRDGEPVGYIASGAHGHSFGHDIGLGYVVCADGVSDAWLDAGRYALEIATIQYPATVSTRPLYDPQGARIKG
jgi:4-methylaminobutanoate oxidase (formaldehyde-forming)